MWKRPLNVRSASDKRRAMARSPVASGSAKPLSRRYAATRCSFAVAAAARLRARCARACGAGTGAPGALLALLLRRAVAGRPAAFGARTHHPRTGVGEQEGLWF